MLYLLFQNIADAILAKHQPLVSNSIDHSFLLVGSVIFLNSILTGSMLFDAKLHASSSGLNHKPNNTYQQHESERQPSHAKIAHPVENGAAKPSRRHERNAKQNRR